MFENSLPSLNVCKLMYMFRSNNFHLNKLRFPEVQIREAWVSRGGKYCFSWPERKEAVYSKLAMRNASCLLALLLDRDWGLRWVGPSSSYWFRNAYNVLNEAYNPSLHHTRLPSAYFFFRSSPRLIHRAWMLLFTKFKASSRTPANLGIVQRWEAISDSITEEKATQRYVMS